MIIEITEPELEALILQRLQSGAFQNAEDLILHALKTSEPKGRTVQEVAQARNLAELFAIHRLLASTWTLNKTRMLVARSAYSLS